MMDLTETVALGSLALCAYLGLAVILGKLLRSTAAPREPWSGAVRGDPPIRVEISDVDVALPESGRRPRSVPAW